VKTIKAPNPNSVNPMRIFRNLFVCWSVLKTISLASRLTSKDHVPLLDTLDAPAIQSASHLHANFQIGNLGGGHLPRAFSLLIMDFRLRERARGFSR
jgi:hypothetical protein